MHHMICLHHTDSLDWLGWEAIYTTPVCDNLINQKKTVASSHLNFQICILFLVHTLFLRLSLFEIVFIWGHLTFQMSSFEVIYIWSLFHLSSSSFEVFLILGRIHLVIWGHYFGHLCLIKKKFNTKKCWVQNFFSRLGQ